MEEPWLLSRIQLPVAVLSIFFIAASSCGFSFDELLQLFSPIGMNSGVEIRSSQCCSTINQCTHLTELFSSWRHG